MAKILAFAIVLALAFAIVITMFVTMTLTAYGLHCLGVPGGPAFIVSGVLHGIAIQWWWPIRDGGWNPPWQD